MNLNAPRLLVAGTHSGVGKTTLTLGMLAALKRRQMVVQSYKVGPDYIDPSYHTALTGRTAASISRHTGSRVEMTQRGTCQGT